MIAVDGYAAAAPLWMEAGWSPLPLPRGKKAAPPTGYTGDDGAYPDAATVETWSHDNPTGNLGLRMPPGVIGIDLDIYKGAEVVTGLDELELHLGPLPATWFSTSDRGDSSGILLYRLPQPMRLRDKPIAGVEIIQRHHRYAVTWPSIHPEGRHYKICNPDGTDAERLPTPEELTELPAAWIAYLTEPVATTRPINGHPWDALRGDSWFDVVVETFNQATTWPQILEPHGWRLRRHSGGIEYWTRPGKELRDGHSATIGATPSRDRLVVHSTDTPFDCSPTSYDRFSAYTILEHGGDRTTAARALRDQYGPPEAPRKPPSAPRKLPAMPATAFLPADFYTARPMLTHIRQAAHSRNRAADAVLHATLARLSAMTPFTIELPAIVGSAGSLNYYAAIIAASGIGKSNAVAISGRLLPIRIASQAGIILVDDKPLGSGEGLAELYMGTIPLEDENGKTKQVRGQEFHHAFIYIDEGDAIGAQADRKGTTILEALRRAWSGATLGQSNAAQDRTRVIPTGMYRMGLVAGFQPERAGRLLADEIGGTPQRFIFAMATDPSIPTPAPEWPGPLPWKPPDAGQLDRHRDLEDTTWVRHPLNVHPDIATEIRTRDLAKARGETPGDPLDAHGDLHRLKLAALLALLDGRMDINLEDGALATIAWNTSRSVRGWVLEAVAAEAEQEETARINRHVRREITVDLARQETPGSVERVARLLASWIHNNPPDENGHANRKLKQAVAGRDRGFFDPALQYAIEQSWIQVRDDRFHPGTARPA